MKDSVHRSHHEVQVGKKSESLFSNIPHPVFASAELLQKQVFKQLTYDLPRSYIETVFCLISEY